jgi:hypothetical protein
LSSPKSVGCKGFFESDPIASDYRYHERGPILRGLKLEGKERTKRAPKDSDNLEAFLSA